MRSAKALLLWGLASFSAPVASLAFPPLFRETRDIQDTSSIEKRADDKPPEKTPKYFVEAGRNIELGHYDGRYFENKVSYEEHRFVLRDLIRSYLFTMNSFGVETWIAHGTLLGWWWNGQIMPWDYDLDVQVSNNTLQWIGDNLNRTEYSWNYTETSTGNFISKKYLLDINPHHVDIDRSDGRNIIDGRWIDMQNGMYVDITGLREREVDRPGVWSCKNKHRYKSQDLWPMRITEFEGVKARVPFNFNKILVDEYDTKSLVTESWAGHRWDHDNKIWVKENEEEAKQRKLGAVDRHLAEAAANPPPEETTSTAAA
ncbi:LicD family-domain-containing protein [Fusarium tricinctum]|uniref:LicD family-domain-containing protein n=1 Tax=Fusarium tricinctum TaxID=61284 RepID=A0A8K0SAP4_9HYPO|nr:LicD family-domain-containing protein [Fusarium tricinctum]